MKQGRQYKKYSYPNKLSNLMFNIEYLINKLFASTISLKRNKRRSQAPILFNKPHSRREPLTNKPKHMLTTALIAVMLYTFSIIFLITYFGTKAITIIVSSISNLLSRG